MSKEQLEKAKHDVILVSNITESVIEFRDQQEVANDKDSEEFENLKRSIENNGLTHPILVKQSEKTKDNYVVIDGRRRLLAHQQLGLKGIPAVIIPNLDKLETYCLAVSSNIHRKNLKEGEITDTIIKAFGEAGYYDAGIIYKHTSTLNSKEYYKRQGKDVKSRFDVPENFIKTVDLLGLSTSWISQVIRWKVNLAPDVYDKVIKENYRSDYRNLLANKTLREHPDTQMDLAREIKHLNLENAKARVKAVTDKLKGIVTEELQTEQEQEEAQETEEEQLEGEPEIAEEPIQKLTKIVTTTRAFLKAITGLETDNPHEMTETAIRHSEQYMIDIVNSTDLHQLYGITQELRNLKLGANLFIKTVNEIYPIKNGGQKKA